MDTGANVNNRGEAYTENPIGQRGVRTTLKRFSLVKVINAGGDVVRMTEANTKGSLAEPMVEILWHRRETGRQQRKPSSDLRGRHGEILEGLSGSLAPGM